MLAPEHTSESGCMVAGGVFLAVHLGLERGSVLHHDTQLGIVEAELTSVVDVA